MAKPTIDQGHRRVQRCFTDYRLMSTPIPWHFIQQPRHAAEAGNACRDKPRADKAAEQKEGAANGVTENHAE